MICIERKTIHVAQKKHYASAVFSVRFTLFLNDGWNVYLRAIENRILGIRYIERKMRPSLSTVQIAAVASRRATNIAATHPSVKYYYCPLFEDELSPFLSWVYFTGPANEPQCHHLSYRYHLVTSFPSPPPIK
jgi:hypothetical protein